MKLMSLILGVSLMGFSTAFALDEAEITKIMKVANEGEIDAAKLAHKRATNPQVKAFAKKMMHEHEKNKKDLKKVAKKEDIGSDRSKDSKALDKNAENTVDSLKEKKGAEFDKAYMQSQVDMHQSLLTKIETELMPAATTPALKQYLTMTRDHVKAHLDEATTINSSLQ